VKGCARTDQALKFRNRLLATFSHEALSALRPHLESITAARGAVLCEASDSRWRVCFIESGVASLVTEYPAPVVVATVGREGAVGGPTLMLGGGLAFGRYQMLMAGAALAMEAPRFRITLRENPTFHSLCDAYTQAFFEQLLQNIACSRSHAAEQRCARWLLMCDDQSGEDMFELAQDSLAAMLGLPQVVAGAVAARLQRARLIRLREGVITIPDRRKLEAAACVCYRTWHNHYERLLGRAFA
jgi:CRP-like cAMP-binding protein